MIKVIIDIWPDFKHSPYKEYTTITDTDSRQLYTGSSHDTAQQALNEALAVCDDKNYHVVSIVQIYA